MRKRSVPKFIQNGGIRKSLDIQQQLSALSLSWNADDERNDHLRCTKGWTVNVLTRNEPFGLALDGRRR